MSKPASDRRSRENEELVQEANEHVAKAAKTLFGQLEKVHFYCECSNVDCRERIDLTVKAYMDLHRKPDHFIVVPGHEDMAQETIIDKQAGYYLVKKG